MRSQLSDILDEKGSTVYRVAPTDSMLHAVETMSEKHVGALLVCEDDRPVGIVTERDVMTRLILRGRDPRSTTVAVAMTREVVVVEPSTSIDEAMAIMTQRRCRHLPVVHDGRIVGMVSIGDIVRHLSSEQEFEIRMLTDYVSGSITHAQRM